MAASDSTIAFSTIDSVLTLYDGAAHSITVGLIQSEWQWTRTGATFVEVLVRGLHQSPPCFRKTGDGKITGSFKAAVATLYGSAGPSLDEWLHMTDGASAYTSTGTGDRKSLKAILVTNASGAGGASQTFTFRYCVFSNIAIDPSGGIWMISADFEDAEENHLRA